MNTVTSIQNRLLSMQDTAYRNFNKRLIPTVSEDTVIGIRVPVLRKMAKRLFAEDPEAAFGFMQTLPHRYFEENHLHAFLIECIHAIDEALEAAEAFLPYIDNWATCDSFLPPVFKKHPDTVYPRILHWLHSPHCYTVRYGLRLLEALYLDGNWKPEIFEHAAAIRSDEYYVNMMIAWYFSTALAKRPNEALPYIEEKRLSPFTHNKTIQKAVESRRVSNKLKAYLKTLKIK